MTQTQQLIEKVRIKMEGATDYKIAQALDIPTGIVHYYVKGDRDADSYTCARIAEILERDPLEIIAQVEAEAARTEKKRQYWRSFFSGMKHKAHVAALFGICSFLGQGLQVGNAEAGASASSHNVRLRRKNTLNHYVKKPRQILGAFFCLAEGQPYAASLTQSAGRLF